MENRFLHVYGLKDEKSRAMKADLLWLPRCLVLFVFLCLFSVVNAIPYPVNRVFSDFKKHYEVVDSLILTFPTNEHTPRMWLSLCSLGLQTPRKRKDIPHAEGVRPILRRSHTYGVRIWCVINSWGVPPQATKLSTPLVWLNSKLYIYNFSRRKCELIENDMPSHTFSPIISSPVASWLQDINKTIFDKSKDKKIKTIKDNTKQTIQNKLLCDNKVNKSNTPCFLSHFHFATTDPNADRGCKNKFI